MMCKNICLTLENKLGRILYSRGDKWCTRCCIGFKLVRDWYRCPCCDGVLKGKTRYNQKTRILAVKRNKMPNYDQIPHIRPPKITRNKYYKNYLNLITMN